MFCPHNDDDYHQTFLCLSTKKEFHWFWIVVPLILLLVCLIYFLSRPTYARISSYNYQRLDPIDTSSNAIPAVRSALDQCLEKTATLFSNDDQQNMSNYSLNNKSMTKSSPWREFRTPTMTNYPDLIDVSEAKRMHSSSKNHSSLSNNLLALIERGAIESDPSTRNVSHGRLWFFIEYNPYLHELYLTIVKARQLPTINGCEPTTFVRAELIPSGNETLTTDVIRSNSNPDYMTEMIFHLNLIEFSDQALKLSVHQIDRDIFHLPIGTIYYPLDHLLIAQRGKGQMIWRNLLPDYGDPSAIGLMQIRATVWYEADKEYLNIYVHSLRATGVVNDVSCVYVHTSVAIKDTPILPQQYLESSELSTHTNQRSQRGPIIFLNNRDETTYDQLFRFVIYKREFDELKVVLDVFRRSIGEPFYNDILLGRTILKSSPSLKKPE